MKDSERRVSSGVDADVVSVAGVHLLSRCTSSTRTCDDV